MSKRYPFLKGYSFPKALRSTNIRIVVQSLFFLAFLGSIWATWTSRIKGFPVSAFLEMDPLVGVFTLISSGHLYRYLGWGLAIFLLTIVLGRVFCNWMCPYGSLHQFIGWLFGKRTPRQWIDSNRYRPIFALKYIILAAFLTLAALGSLQIGLLDPIVIMYRTFTTIVAPAFDLAAASVAKWGENLPLISDLLTFLQFSPGIEDPRVFVGSFALGMMFLGLIVANVFIPRFFCRAICPLGAFLGIISRYSLFRIHRNVDKCIDCDMCLKSCEGASDPHATLRLSECFACMNCIDDCPADALSYTMWTNNEAPVLAQPDISKRQMVFGALAGLFTYPLFKNRAFSQDRAYSGELIRPPGSVNEPQFLERCIKCDQCINVCPTNVLQPAKFEESGPEGLWTPVMKFEIGHCQFKCTLCSEVCPTGAIQEISAERKLGLGQFQDDGPVRLGTAFFDKGRCLPHAMEIPCVVCEEVCPTSPKAIQTKDVEIKNVFGEMVTLNKPFIVPDLCIGCGICESECPVRDDRAVYVTAVGESRSARHLLLSHREP